MCLQHVVQVILDKPQMGRNNWEISADQQI
jgi:hypothetical protein